MHGVRSSYYSSRDSMGKSNPVREALEDYFDVPDLWANLEDSLAHFDLNRMCNGYVMDAQLDIAKAYERMLVRRNTSWLWSGPWSPCGLLRWNCQRNFKRGSIRWKLGLMTDRCHIYLVTRQSESYASIILNFLKLYIISCFATYLASSCDRLCRIHWQQSGAGAASSPVSNQHCRHRQYE